MYYHHTPEDELKPITMPFPILNIEESGSRWSPPKMVGFRQQRLLENSEVLQRRVVSRHRERTGDHRYYQAEWIWKEGHGLTLMEYRFVSYDKENRPHEVILYPENVKP